MNNYKKNKNWNMFVEKNKLFITKGADEIYFVDDVDEENANDVYKAYCDEKFEQLDSNILNKLIQAGVLYTSIKNTSELKVAIKYIGSNNFDVCNCIKKHISNSSNIKLVDNLEDCDLLLIIRTNEKLREVLRDYNKIEVPHLFIDLAYSNTISIGPIVYKNESACLGCFIGRITKNWGDPIPPEEPQILKKHELISSLILERLNEFITLGNCPDLVNGVWNFNTNEFSTKLDTIYKLPWCPICNLATENEKIELPWIQGECLK